MGKECMARLSRRLWGGTSLKTAAKEATSVSVVVNVENKESINDWQLSSCYWVAVWQSQSEIW